jgi:hypothetical protein
MKLRCPRKLEFYFLAGTEVAEKMAKGADCAG